MYSTTIRQVGELALTITGFQEESRSQHRETAEQHRNYSCV